MSEYLTIDGGTTNTRISYLKDNLVKDVLKLKIGAKIGAESKERYREAIKKGIEEILQRNNISERSIEKIICSGMITSEGGLVDLPHLIAPVGIAELSAGLYETALEDISCVPFVFIPGVKTSGSDFTRIDMMRGEETELFGIFDTPLTDTLYVLPGSHSKLIKTDGFGRISDFSTELTGEMIACLSEGTILKASVQLEGARIDEEYLKLGCTLAQERGINFTLFKVRILDKIAKANSDRVYSLFLGAVLSSEVKNIIETDVRRVAIGGKSILKQAIALLLKEFSTKEIIILEDSVSDSAPAFGAMKIYEAKKICE